MVENIFLQYRFEHNSIPIIRISRIIDHFTYGYFSYNQGGNCESDWSSAIGMSYVQMMKTEISTICLFTIIKDLTTIKNGG